jgi:hypothetical protein
MWKFVTGAKEPVAKKSKKDCQKIFTAILRGNLGKSTRKT